jgi:hypothetical protein
LIEASKTNTKVEFSFNYEEWWYEYTEIDENGT